MIAIVDYGMGNLRSVANALQAIGAEAVVTADPAALRQARGIVLPGVGAFGEGMRNLHQAGLVEVLGEQVLQAGKPFLGICLGLQLLATTGFEHGRHDGLGWIPGTVERIPVPADTGLRLPHIGWNEVRILKREGLYAGMAGTQCFYFVHSYVFVPEDEGVASGVCAYGTEWVASVQAGNITAVQFHPEKSHTAGLGLLRSWHEGVLQCSKGA